MFGLLKALAKIAVWAALVLVVAYSFAFRYLNDRTLGAFISDKVNQADRGEFRLGYARYDFWSGLFSIVFNTPAHVVGGEYTLRDPDGNLVLEVPEVQTDAYLQELVGSLLKYAATGRFHLTLHFGHARVPHALAVIAPTRSTWVSEKHEVNILAAFASRKLTPSTGEFRVRVDDVTLEDLDFGLRFPNAYGQVSWSGQATDARAVAQLEYSSRRELENDDGPYFFFGARDLEAAQGEVRLGEYQFPLEDLKVGWFGTREERQTIAFSGHARTRGAQVTVEGALLDSYAKVPGLQMTLGFQHGQKLLALLPRPLDRWLRGDPSGSIDFRGPFSHVVLDGKVKGAAADLEGIKIADLGARLHLDGELLQLEPEGAVAGGKAHAEAQVGLERLPWWRAQLSVKRVDPALLQVLPEALRAQLAGKLDATVRLGGSLVPRDVDTIYAQAIDATLTREKPGKLPQVVRLSGGLDWAPTRVQLKSLAASGDGLELEASGNIDPRSGRLDTALLVQSHRGASWPLGFGAPRAFRTGETRLEGRLSGTLERPLLGAHLSAHGIGLGERLAERLEADLRLENGKLTLKGLSGEAFGGALEGEGELELFEDGRIAKPLAEPTVRLGLRARGVDLQRLVGVRPETLSGQGQLTLDVHGALRDPEGLLEVELPAIALRGDPYVNGQLKVALGQGGATIERLRLIRKAGGTLAGTGRVGWDGSLQLSLKPHDFPLAAIPGIRGLPVALEGTLSGDVSLGGDPERPALGGIISLVGFKVRDVLFGDGNLKLIPGADALHIKGSLFHTIDVDGYVTLFPKLTVAGTLRFRDVALEKILPELRKFAELSGTASGEARISFDAASGVTFAGLTLDELKVSVGAAEDGGARRALVVRNEDPVKLSTDGNVLRIDRCRLVSSLGGFQILGQVAEKDSNVRLHGDIDLVLLEYFFRGFFEHTHGKSNVDLTIAGDLAKPKVAGWLAMSNAELQPRWLDHLISVPTGRVLFTENRMTLEQFSVKLDDQVVQASGFIELDNWVPGRVQGDVKGDLSARLLQLFFKDYVAEAAGSIAVDVHLGGTFSAPEWSGRADVRRLSGKLRNWPHDLMVSAGSLRFVGSDIVLGCPKSRGGGRCRTLAGSIDEHPVAIDGAVSVGGPTMLKALDVLIDGSELRQETGEYSIGFSPHVRIHGDGTRLTASGEVALNEGRYSQNYDLLDSVLRPRTAERVDPFWVGYPLLETMGLEVRVQSAGSLYIKNNIADMSMSVNLEITGTLSEPRLDGVIRVEEGGTFTIPTFRVPFTAKPGEVVFDPEKKLPEQTPSFNLSAEGAFVDANDNSHLITMRIGGTIPGLQLSFESSEGWDPSTVLSVVITGQTPEQWRQRANASGSVHETGPSGTENVLKTATGIGVGQVLANPFQKYFGLDVTTVEFGSSSFDVRLCKRAGRFIKACGYGEVGFAGSSRVEGSLQLRLSDRVSANGKVEYLNQTIDVTQDSLTHGKIELKLQIPLGY